MRDLLYAALLQSDNVAADTLAEFVGRDLLRTASADGGSAPSARRGAGPSGRRAFIVEMNALARQLHMDRTRFLNPSGLDGTERPFSTAADMARSTRNVRWRRRTSAFSSRKRNAASPSTAPGARAIFSLHNTNQLLGTHRIDGGKTGSTARAGECLMLTRGTPDPIVWMEGTTSHITPRRLIVVLLGSSDRFGEGAALIERGTTLYDQWMAAGHPWRTDALSRNATANARIVSDVIIVG